MLTVVIESPYAADTAAGIERNLRYARACMAYCLAQDAAPYASHALYTQPGVLNDKLPEERKKGMRAGFAIGAMLQERWFFTDLGMTDGMKRGEEAAQKKGQIVRRLSIPDWEQIATRDELVERVFGGLVFRFCSTRAPARNVVAAWGEDDLSDVFSWLRVPEDNAIKLPRAILAWARENKIA